MMKIETKYCGEITYQTDELIRFPDGLFGFEEEHDFLLIQLEDDEASPFCLQSTTHAETAFIVLDPFQLMPDYAPDLSDEDCARLGDPTGEHIALYAICVLRDPMTESTVNLRCPIAMHMETRTAFQVMLTEDNGYTFRHKLSELASAKEEPSC